MVQATLPTPPWVRTWQGHRLRQRWRRESLRCRVSLVVGVPLRQGACLENPLPPLWKQEGESNLLNLCVDKLSCSAEEDCPELICLFKLLVVIVTSPLPSSGTLTTHSEMAFPCPIRQGSRAGVFFSWGPGGQSHLWGRLRGGGSRSLRTRLCVMFPFVVVGARAVCSFRGPQDLLFPRDPWVGRTAEHFPDSCPCQIPASHLYRENVPKHSSWVTLWAQT